MLRSLSQIVFSISNHKRFGRWLAVQIWMKQAAHWVKPIILLQVLEEYESRKSSKTRMLRIQLPPEYQQKLERAIEKLRKLERCGSVRLASGRREAEGPIWTKQRGSNKSRLTLMTQPPLLLLLLNVGLNTYNITRIWEKGFCNWYFLKNENGAWVDQN